MFTQKYKGMKREQYCDEDRLALDIPSRETTVEWLTNVGYQLVDTDEGREGWKDYDLMFTKHNEYVKVEIECKRSWGNVFLYNEYHIPARKQNQPSDMFICYNVNRTQAFVVKGDVVRSSCIITKDTKCKHDQTKDTKDEEFFAVDVKNGTFWKKEGDKWRRQ